MSKDLGYLYDDEFKKHGERSKLLWGCEGRAEASYAAICKEIDFRGSTVLDVGCGFGGFCSYLIKKGQVPIIVLITEERIFCLKGLKRNLKSFSKTHINLL